MRPVLLISVLVFCLDLALAASAAADEHHRIDVDGIARTYDVHVPPGLTAAAPLVVVLHGRGSSGQEEIAKGDWHATADRNRFIVAAPDALTSYDGVEPRRELTIRDRLRHAYWTLRGWNLARWHGGSNDVGLILSMVDRIATKRKIDRSRIYVTGYSRGGFMAHTLALETPGQFAGVAVVSPDEEPDVTKPLARPVSFLLLTGDHDRYHPISGGRPAATMKRWQSLDHCPSLAARKADAANETVESAGPCEDGTEIRYVIVHGVGHEWAGAPTSYSEIAWKFLSRFTRPSPDGG
jgi:polyhydroxybutyrate depolymerase